MLILARMASSVWRLESRVRTRGEGTRESFDSRLGTLDSRLCLFDSRLCRNASTTLVLPIPASPVTKTSWRAPLSALANQVCSCRSSASRPTREVVSCQFPVASWESLAALLLLTTEY
jgi:hypothetical protein